MYRAPVTSQSGATYTYAYDRAAFEKERSARSSSQTYVDSGTATFIDFPPPPSTPAAAMLLYGSRQWHAGEGNYSVATFNNENNPACGDEFINPIFQTGPLSGTRTAVYPSTTLYTDPGGSIIPAPPPMYIAPMNMSGAYYTGLSLQTTLAITVHWYVEVFPDISSPLVTLARPSPSYDPAALSLYSMLLADLPVGVMVKDNGLGDWFASAVSKVASVASPILRMIPHPLAQAGAMAADAAGGIATSFITGNDLPKNRLSKSRGQLQHATADNSDLDAIAVRQSRKNAQALGRIERQMKGRRRKR